MQEKEIGIHSKITSDTLETYIRNIRYKSKIHQKACKKGH